MASTTNISFKVSRKTHELIPPAMPTPHEFKPLSDIDDQGAFRSQITFIQFYRRSPSMEGKDPVKVIRDAIAKALVFYYPFAGRLRETVGRKLVVECTGEGVVFVEADADITLQEFGDDLYPPFPCMEELLSDVPTTAGIINCPLLLFQVTRLKCGGFVVAIRLNHTMSDAGGLVQLMFAIAEFSRGAQSPSIPPVWQRHLLNARNPPCVTHNHHEYNIINPRAEQTLFTLDNLVHRSFHFHAVDIAALRNTLPPHLHESTDVEVVIACMWRCRTIAISQDPKEEVQICCVVNIRKRFNPPLPKGYYGNAIVYPAAITTAGKLTEYPLYYAVDLVKQTKSKATEKYVRSVADLMVTRDRPIFKVVGTYIVSDVTRMYYDEVDFGWGKAAYGGPATGSTDHLSCAIPLKNKNGENGIVVPLCLPMKAMEAFKKELQSMMQAAQISSGFQVSAQISSGFQVSKL